VDDNRNGQYIVGATSNRDDDKVWELGWWGDGAAGAYDGEGETINIYFLSLQSIDLIV
jgi:hypothetical protein